jgi:hypothetical protein
MGNRQAISIDGDFFHDAASNGEIPQLNDSRLLRITRRRQCIIVSGG